MVIQDVTTGGYWVKSIVYPPLYYFLQLNANLQLSKRKKVLESNERYGKWKAFVKDEVQYGCYYYFFVFIILVKGSFKKRSH